MERVKADAEVGTNKEFIDKAVRRTLKRLHFSPKARREEKKMLLEMLKSVRKDWDKMPDLKEETRKIMSTMATFCTSMLSVVEGAEKWSQARVLKNKRFTLWQHPFRNETVVLFTFYRVSEKQNQEGSLVFPEGLPQKEKPVPALFFLHGFDVSGYLQADRGTFFRRPTTIRDTVYTLRGKEKIRLFLKSEKNSDENYLAELLPIK